MTDTNRQQICDRFKSSLGLSYPVSSLCVIGSKSVQVIANQISLGNVSHR